MNNTKREIYELRTCIYMKNEVTEKEREREREGGRYRCCGEVNFPITSLQTSCIREIVFWEKNVLE